MSVGTMAQKLGERQFGGIVVFDRNIADPYQASMLLNLVGKANRESGGKTDYFFAIDQEGGRVSRLTGGTKFSGNMALGAANDESLVLETAGVIGAELSEVGFNLDFAPDVDVNDNPGNPVIGVRSFSDDPDEVLIYVDMLRNLPHPVHVLFERERIYTKTHYNLLLQRGRRKPHE